MYVYITCTHVYSSDNMGLPAHIHTRDKLKCCAP